MWKKVIDRCENPRGELSPAVCHGLETTLFEIPNDLSMDREWVCRALGHFKSIGCTKYTILPSYLVDTGECYITLCGYKWFEGEENEEGCL